MALESSRLGRWLGSPLLYRSFADIILGPMSLGDAAVLGVGTACPHCSEVATLPAVMVGVGIYVVPLLPTSGLWYKRPEISGPDGRAPKVKARCAISIYLCIRLHTQPGNSIEISRF